MDNHFINYEYMPEEVVVLGKGPTYSDYVDELDNYLVGLNHVALALQKVVDVVVFNDYDLYTKNIINNAIHAFCPYRPHINFKPSPTVIELEGTYQFDLSTWKGKPHVGNPIINAKFNVAESAFDLLGHLGVKKITSYGINGGSEYALEFSHLKPLENGQPNFDKQMGELLKLCAKHGIDWIKK